MEFKIKKVSGYWRRLHNEEFQYLCPSPNFIRALKSKGMRLAGHVARMGHMRNAYNILFGKPERKIPLGRPKRRWKYIRMDLRERLQRCGLDSSVSG
jgi:hypothetical protein